MYPELISLPHVSSYPVLLLAGFFFAWFTARRRCRGVGLAPRHIDNLSLTLVMSGLLGARLVSRIFYIPDVTVWTALKVWEGGGLVFYGGLIFGVASALLYSKLARVPLLALLDVY